MIFEAQVILLPMRNIASNSVESVIQEVLVSRVSVSPRSVSGSSGGWVGLSQPGEHVLKRKGHQSWQQGVCVSAVGKESQAQNGVFHQLLLGSIPRMPAR